MSVPRNGCCRLVARLSPTAGQHNEAVAAKGGDEEEYKNWAWVDSRLTELGKKQASALRPRMAGQAVDVVLVSPLSRTIQTALLGVPHEVPFIVEELVRERNGMHPCDKRRSRAELAADFPTVDVMTLATEQDESWSEAREPWEVLVQRADSTLHVLRSRPERHIAVVTHNDFLTALLYDSSLLLADEALRVKFGNADHLPLVLTWEA
jgi:broad specificity phosphatase PhoE